MRKLFLGNPSGPDDTLWAIQALKTIEGATFEDVEAIINDFTVTGVYTPARTLNTSTATLADLIAFVATLVTDIQKRGQNRTGG